MSADAPRPLDDQHPITREFLAMSHELLGARSSLTSYEDVLARDGITDPRAVAAIYAIIRNGVEVTREQSARTGNTGQAVGDGLLSCIRFGIRLARKGLV